MLFVLHSINTSKLVAYLTICQAFFPVLFVLSKVFFFFFFTIFLLCLPSTFISRKIPINFPRSNRRLKSKCKCDRSEDGEDEEQRVKVEDDKKDVLVVEGNDENSLSRTPCHDSGIDIRDSLPTVPIIPTKKVRN